MVERICRSIVGGNRKYLRTRLRCGRKPSERTRVSSGVGIVLMRDDVTRQEGQTKQ